jgi:FkbH-like protein
VDQREFFKSVTALTKSGQHEEALEKLQDALGRNALDAEAIEKAGRLCDAAFAATATSRTRVAILAQCTSTWLSHALTATAWGRGHALHVVDGAYDNVIQELMAASSKIDVVVLLPWHQRLLFSGFNRPSQERIDEACAFWQQAWGLVTGRLGSRILQVGYDWITPGPLGYGLGGRGDGDVAVIRAANDALRRALPAGAAFIDLEQISGVMGRERFYDPRRHYWTKQPFSEAGTVRLSEHIAASVSALITGPKKVLVLDLDNTLWGGVVGETGPLGIALGEGPDGEAFRHFQEHVKKLSDRGVVLAVCSKNNDADAREPFTQNPNMALSLDDFAQFEATWDPKATVIRRIAKTLQLGVDSFVFFDDNPAEREQVRQALPEVAVVEVPEDPAEFIRALDAALWFEATDLTGEDRARSEQYRADRKRRESEVAFESLDAYLGSLEMVADVRRVDEADLDRVVQLIGKTNQFNLTTRRHSFAKVRALIEDPGTVALTLRMIDRFGDYGLVSVIIGVPDSARPGALRIDTWLMSCRVINRTVEEFFFNTLIEECRAKGVGSLVGVYAATAKNGLVANLYPRLGFTPRGPAEAGQQTYDLELTPTTAAKTFVRSLALTTQNVPA